MQIEFHIVINTCSFVRNTDYLNHSGEKWVDSISNSESTGWKISGDEIVNVSDILQIVGKSG